MQIGDRLFHGGDELFHDVILLSEAVTFGVAGLCGIGLTHLYNIKAAKIVFIMGTFGYGTA